jgi:hypothetical protein
MGTGPVIPGQIRRRSAGLGCLGCLGKMVGYLVGFGILGFILLLAIDAVFLPWSFHMGGRFHPIPMWRGWGRMHSGSGHDYALYVWFEPYHHSGRGGTAINAAGPEVVGWGELCTPQGEHYELRVRGYLPRNIGASTDGQRMELDAYRRPWYYGFVGRWDEGPTLNFTAPGTIQTSLCLTTAVSIVPSMPTAAYALQTPGRGNRQIRACR